MTVCVSKKCLFEIDGLSLDLLGAGGHNLALNSLSSLLALQFMVQQRSQSNKFQSFNWHILPELAYSSYNSHQLSGPRRLQLKEQPNVDHSKKNNKFEAYKIIALRCKLEGFKAEKSDARQARCREEILAALQSKKQRSTGRCFIHCKKMQSSEICKQL